MKKILIANRGEPALRVLRTINAVAHTKAFAGIQAVGIYATDDSGLPYLQQCSETVALKGTGVSAYLDIDAVIEAAKATDCDAVHPGWGFLSENAAFAQALKAHGITFIGPDTKVLATMGDKRAALAHAQSINVPTLPRLSEARDPSLVFEFQRAHQDVILKAASGGGGRGMRRLSQPQSGTTDSVDVEKALASAGREAKASFGDATLYAEKYLPFARHIEVQVLADNHGQVMALGERECTLQRRHQKVIEMCPSPHLSEALRTAIHQAAIDFIRPLNYCGLGTVEFLTDGKDFYFIECNPRLQVEHTVTELVYGQDLVEIQLQIAKGQSLQDIFSTAEGKIPSLTPTGFAIQARVNAEKMTDELAILPQAGSITQFQPPIGRGVRVDTHLRQGMTISAHYDSLLAKVIAYNDSGSYSQALEQLYTALDEFYISGIETNIRLLQALVRHPDVQRDAIHTQFIEDNGRELLTLANSLNARQSQATNATNTLGAADTGSEVAHAGVRLGDADPLAVLNYAKEGEEAQKANQNPEPTATSGHQTAAQEDLPTGHFAIVTPLQGKVVEINVSEGDEIAKEQTVAVMESMKMEHEIRAPQNGRILRVRASVGDTLYENQSIVIGEEAEVAQALNSSKEEIDLDHIRPDLQEVLDRKAAGHDHTREEAVQKRHAKGHRTARENIEDLCDPGSFVEYGSVVLAAQRRRRKIDDLIRKTTADGFVCGLGRVNSDLFGEEQARILAVSYDYMVLAGTQGKKNHLKKDRMFDLAGRYKWPTILYAEGGGGRPGDTDADGVAGLDNVAWRYFAQLSPKVPTIGITNGFCFAGNAVLLGLCDIIIATSGSNIGIGGPAMIEGGGLGVFRPEEVGPLDVQVANGVVDLAVQDEAEATAAAKKLLGYFQGTVKDYREPDPRKLRFAVPENRLRFYDMRAIINGIADVDSVLELRRDWAVGIITSFIRVEGKPIGVIANDPGHLSGALDSPGADKAARFMQLCDARNIPVLTLIDCPGIMVGPEIEKTALVRHASRLFMVGSNLQTPVMSIVIRKAYGLGAMAMAGADFKLPLFTVTWPTGEFGGMGLEGAVKLGQRRELEAVNDPQERIKLYERLVAEAYERGKAVNMASHFEIDEVIDPAESRKYISAALNSLPPTPKNDANGPDTGRYVDTW